MAGFDPNNDKFGALPPHFIFTDPMKNDAIAIAMRMMFGKILLYHPKFVSILLRCFACVVHHHEELIIQMCKIPGHAFCKLEILNNLPLLKQLKTFVTTAPTEGVITCIRGTVAHTPCQKNEICDG